MKVLIGLTLAVMLAGCAPSPYYRPAPDPYYLSNLFFRFSEVSARNAAALGAGNNNLHCTMMYNTMNCFSL